MGFPAIFNNVHLDLATIDLHREYWVGVFVKFTLKFLFILLFSSDVNKDMSQKDKDKAKDSGLKDKDKDKDLGRKDKDKDKDLGLKDKDKDKDKDLIKSLFKDSVKKIAIKPESKAGISSKARCVQRRPTLQMRIYTQLKQYVKWTFEKFRYSMY